VKYPALLIPLILIAGCADLSKPYPAKELFSLDAPALSTAPATHPGALRVERVRIAAPFDARTFVYRVNESQYQPDYYREFVADPDRLITTQLVAALAEARVFQTVVDTGAGVDTPFLLETSITEFYADLRQPDSPHAVVRARCILIADRSAAATVLADWVVESRKPAADSAPASLAAAWNAALGDVFSQIANRLAGATLSPP